MRKDVILFFMLFLLVVSSSDQAPPTPETENFRPMNFVLSQTEMPIYELVTPDVNESYVQGLASSLFGIHDIMAEETEGIYYVNWSNSYLEVDSIDGSIWFADYDRIWNISLGDAKPNQTESQIIAEAWLDEKGLVPSNAEFAGIGGANVTIFNPVTEAMHSKIMHYNFNYEFVVPDLDIPITGEAAQITVMIGEEGEITGPAQNIVGFDWKWRDIHPTPYATAVLIEFDSILETYDIPDDSVVACSLVYDTGEEDSNNDLLYPVYDVTLIESNDGYETEFNLKFDATEFQPHTGIIQPSSSIRRQPGVAISFDCQAFYGTPPYSYLWYSDFDGTLSTSKNFTTSSLSEVVKDNIRIPHSIALIVKDSENQYSYDMIAVTIDSTAAMSIDVGIVFVALGALILVSALIIFARKKGSFVILFLLMLLSAFIFLPVTSAYSETNKSPEFRPSAPTGAFDDGIKEVGIEWLGLSYEEKKLTVSEGNCKGFYNHMGSIGSYSQEFSWGEYSAWSSDFEDTTNNGNDSQWIDAVDMVYYQGHGGPDAITFTYFHNSEWAYFSKMKLGDGDLETLALDSCSTLSWEGGFLSGNVFERWGPTLHGVHQVCGFATGAKNTQWMGPYFAQYMTGLYPLPALTILASWFRAGVEAQPSEKIAAVFYGTNSTNPFQPQLDDPINDHAKGFGYVCSDPVPEVIEWYVYITSSC